MKKLLTISVAAYNVERFLKNTLKSLSDSRYVDKLEVFVIDDGGNDNSIEIAKSYEKQFPQTFHAIHKENGGYGSTVNYSIEHATGKYFKLLDGDDWMDCDGLKEVLEKLAIIDDDVIITDFYTGPTKDELTVVSTRNKDNSVVNVREFETSYPYGMWAIFYKTEILKKSKVKLIEHSLYTDQIYSTIPFSIAKTIRFINIPVYCYRVGREEQSTSKPSRLKHSKEMLHVCSLLYDFYEEHKDNKYILSRVARYYIVALKTLMIFPVSFENRIKLINYEYDAKLDHKEIYEKAIDGNLAASFVNLMRKTSYWSYWLLFFIPDKYLT